MPSLTQTQIRSRPVILELTYGMNKNKLQHIIASEYEYNKLFCMSGKDTVNIILDRHEDNSPESKDLERKIKSFIEIEKGLYTIQLPTGVLRCMVKIHDPYSVILDERNKNITDYLQDTIIAPGRRVWLASMYIMEKTF